MKNYKNYLIALLTGLLVLSLSTQQAQSAASSKDARSIEYAQCLSDFQWKWKEQIKEINIEQFIPLGIKACIKYRP